MIRRNEDVRVNEISHTALFAQLLNLRLVSVTNAPMVNFGWMYMEEQTEQLVREISRSFKPVRHHQQ